MLKSKKTQIFFCIVFITAILSCKKKAQNNNNNNVPYVQVNITIYPNDPLYFKIQTPGGWMYYNGAGVNGIIIYRKTNTDFVTLERTSTYYPDNPAAAAKVQTDNFTCKDTISGSAWQIIDGGILNGPATFPLKFYQNSYDGNSLRIFN